MSSVLSAAHFQNEEAAFAYVEGHLWPQGPVCPHCGCLERSKRLPPQRTKPSKKHPDGKPVLGLWKCYACRKQFTVRVGTIFEDSHLPLHQWLQAIHLICASKKGISTRQLQRMLNCGMKTAWFLGHRIREAMNDNGSSGPLGGEGKIVEADETYLAPAGGRNDEPANFVTGRGWVAIQGPRQNAIKVVTLVERNGRARSVKVDNLTAATVGSIVRKGVDRASTLHTDEARYYPRIGRDFAAHGTVTHSKGEYARGIVHTNTVEGFFGIFKRGLTGIYQHVSEAHLQRYLAEFDFRYSNRSALGIEDVERTEIALKGVTGKRLTYQTTRAGR